MVSSLLCSFSQVERVELYLNVCRCLYMCMYVFKIFIFIYLFNMCLQHFFSYFVHVPFLPISPDFFLHNIMFVCIPFFYITISWPIRIQYNLILIMILYFNSFTLVRIFTLLNYFWTWFFELNSAFQSWFRFSSCMG